MKKEVGYFIVAISIIIAMLPVIAENSPSLTAFAILEGTEMPLKLSELELEALILMPVRDFERGITDLTLSKKTLRPLVETRILVEDSLMNKDPNSAEIVEVTVVTSLEKKTIKLNELGVNERLFFRRILFVSEYTNKNDDEIVEILTEGEKPVLFFYKNNKGLFRFVGNRNEVKEEKKEELKEQDKTQKEEGTACKKKYSAEDIEINIGFERLKDETSCDGIEAKHKDRSYDLAKQKALEQCSKLSCESSICTCQKSFIFAPYRSEDFECTATTIGDSTDIVITYKNTAACACSCE